MKSSFNKSQVFALAIVSTIVSISFMSVKTLLTENNLVNISNIKGINIAAIQIIAIITSGFIGCYSTSQKKISKIIRQYLLWC